MKKTLILFIVIVSLSALGGRAGLAAQNLDSLWSVWQDPAQHDTVRCKAIDDLAWEGFVYTKPDSALVLAKLMFDFTVTHKLLRQKCYALNLMGISYWIKTEYITAIAYYEKSKALSDSIGNDLGVATALNNIGAVYHNRGYYPKALNYFKQALKIYEARQDTHGIAVAISNIGNIYKEEGDLDKALENSLKSLALYESIGEKAGIATETVSIGSIYASQGDLETGLAYYQKGLEIREEINEQHGVVLSLSMIGTLLTRMNRSAEALPYHDRSLKLAEAIGDKRSYATSLMEKGMTLIDLQKYNQAIILCQDAYERLLDLEILKQQKKACSCLYRAHKLARNDSKALHFLELIRTLDDSLQITETAKKLQQMEFEKLVLADSVANYVQTLKVQETHERSLIQEKHLRNIGLASGLFAFLLAFGLFRRSKFIKQANARLQKERDRSEELLLNILPAEVAEELKEKGESEARDFDKVTVIFTDFIGFTETAGKMSAKELVTEINACFMAFDTIIGKFGIEKIKTIGDAYMAAGGLHVPRESEPKDGVRAALEMQGYMIKRKLERKNQNLPAFEMRVGIHTGPVVAGIVGVKKFQYDIWGDTVNTASRMESNGQAGKVNISQATYELLKDDPDFTFESRGKIEAKGKGEMEMWFVQLKNKP